MAMAFRAVALTRTLPPLPKQPGQQQQQRQTTTHHHHHHTPKLHPPRRLSPPPATPSPATAVLSLITVLFTPASEAKAFSFPKENILSSLTKVEDLLSQIEDAGSRFWDFHQIIFKTLTDTLKPGVDAALPILQNASEEALKVASPVVSDASKQAKEVLQGAGIDPSPVFSAAKTVADAAQQTTNIIEAAKPLASATVEKITSSDPSVIVVSAGALFLGYLLLPPIWSAISFSFRGYKGNLSAAQALDLLSTQNYLMIDVRSEKDKNKAGIPRLPSSAKNKMISVPLEDLPSKIKGLVRNPKKAEADIVALKISYLRRVNKGSNIILMDSYSDIAKIVAKTLTSLGFKNIWNMTDGFSGGRGWMQSRLGIDSYGASITEILSPSRFIPTAAARFGTTSSAALSSTRKLLPGSIEN